MVLDTSRPAEPSSDSLKYSSGGAVQPAVHRRPVGNIAAQLAAPLVHVADFRAVGRRTAEGRIVHRLFGNGNLEARAEVQHFLLVQLFLLVADVAAFAGLAQPVALDGVGQNQGRPAGGFHRGL
jgi:hypothetical protein